MFDAKTVQGAIDALAEGDGESALTILKALLTAAASGGSAPPPSGAAPTAEAAEPTPEQKEFSAFARSVMTLSRTETVGAAEQWIKKLADERTKLDADREALEASERRALVTELVTLKAETPATAWERNAAGEIAEGDARKPVKRLSSEPLAELRERVKTMRGATPATIDPRPPAGVPADESRLSEYERTCAAAITDPIKRKNFVTLRLSRLAPASA